MHDPSLHGWPVGAYIGRWKLVHDGCLHYRIALAAADKVTAILLPRTPYACKLDELMVVNTNVCRQYVYRLAVDAYAFITLRHR